MLTGGMKVVNAAQMRAMDEFTINEIGIPGVVLMENAGRAVVDAIEDFFETEEPMIAAVFCGKGNNGGDGFVIARHLVARGHEAVIYLLANIDDLQGDALVNARIAEKTGLEIREVPDREALSDMVFDPRDFNVIVDAIFGTGLSSAIRGHYLGAIDLINSAGQPVVAVDIPSGLSSDSGNLLGPAIEADLTVTFAYPKFGLVLPPSSNFVGQVVVADISIPEIAESDEPATWIVDERMINPLSLRRDPNSHKGTYGHILAVAGGPGTSGAAAMVGGSALMAGAGLATVGTPASQANVVDGLVLETMTLALQELDGSLDTAAFDEIIQALDGKTALAVGPGVGIKESTIQLIRRLVNEVEVPMVLDADAINAFAGAADLLKDAKADIIITPHPGEMARLLGISTQEVQENRVNISRELAQRCGIHVVLKGYRTVVAEPGGEVFINMSGNPGMATAGAGDVLTGMIVALLGQQDSTVLEAAITGVYLHGLAGDIARARVGENALTASAIMDSIADAFLTIEEVEEHHHHDHNHGE